MENTQDWVPCFWSKIEKGNGCWEWQAGLHHNGLPYGKFYHDGRTHLAHRVMYELTNGPIPDGMQVCHKCDNPKCVRPDHLFLGTHLDNMTDRSLKDRTAKGDRNGRRTHPEKTLRGEKNSNAKLTDSQVQEIRNLRADGVTFAVLSERFCVSVPTIKRVVYGKRYTERGDGGETTAVYLSIETIKKAMLSRLAPRYGFVSPDGVTYPDIVNLKGFCREHDLDYSTMIKVDKGKRKQYKGWKRMPDPEGGQMVAPIFEVI